MKFRKTYKRKQAAVLLSVFLLVTSVAGCQRVGAVKETGEEKTILFGLTGTGFFDMTAYTAYLDGTMTDYIPTDEDLQKGFDSLPQQG